MDGFKLSLLTFFLLAFAWSVNGKPTFDSNEGKNDANGQSSTTTTTTTAKSDEEEATTKAINPSTACGGLKGFLHLCEAISDGNDSENQKVQEVKEGSGENLDGNVRPEEKEPKPDEDGKPESSLKGKVEKREAEESVESDESVSSSDVSSYYRRKVAKPENVEFPTGESDREMPEVESSESDSSEYGKNDEENKGGFRHEKK